MAISYKQYKARKEAKRKANIEAVKRANDARKKQAEKPKHDPRLPCLERGTHERKRGEMSWIPPDPDPSPLPFLAAFAVFGVVLLVLAFCGVFGNG